MTEKKPSRKEQILQSLAHMLEAGPGGRITTAGLAREVGVSEAALYRHFPSKAKMFEGLIEFIEEAIFSRINRITEEGDATGQVEQILTLMLAFTERNPGITRLLTGDALTGENERLHQRILQFYDRVATPTITANLLLAVVEGRIAQFVRSGFKIRPGQDWQAQWELLIPTLFRE